MKHDGRVVVTISPISYVYFFIVLGLVVVLWYLSGLVILVIASILFAAALHPSVQRLQTLKLPRWLAVSLIYLVVFGLLGLAVWAIAPTFTSQLQSIVTNWPNHQARIEAGLANQPLLLTGFQRLTDSVAAKPEIVLGNVGQTAIGLVGSIFGFVTFLVLTFYFLMDSRKIAHSLVRYLPSEKKRQEVIQIASESSVKLGHWIRGQILLSLIVFASTYLFLSIMGIQYSLILALFAGILQFIPFVGAIVGAIPAVLAAITISPATSIIVLIFFVVLQTIVGNIITPQVMNRAVGVSALVVLIAALIGLTLLGFLGVLLAVPVAAVLDVIFETIGSRYVKDKIAEASS